MCGRAKVNTPHPAAGLPLGAMWLFGRLEFCWYSMTIRPLSGRPLMPTYEYACEKCGKNFEAFQSMRDEAFTTCPEQHCQQKKWGKGKVKRLLGTGAGIIFKGSGFYITDYRSSSYQEAAKKDAAPASSAGGEKSSGGEKSGGSKESSSSTSAKPAEAKPKKPATE
jgi:putative FmdB family regulatory protein